MDSLGIAEGEFNIIQKNLGDKYCHYLDSHGGNGRYAINVSECLALQEQYDQESINERRHQQLVRLAVLVAVLGATLGRVSQTANISAIFKMLCLTQLAELYQSPVP